MERLSSSSSSMSGSATIPIALRKISRELGFAVDTALTVVGVGNKGSVQGEASVGLCRRMKRSIPAVRI